METRGTPLVIESTFCIYDVSAAFILKKNVTYGELEVLKFTFGNLISRLYRSLVSDIEEIWIWPRRKVLFQYLNTCNYLIFNVLIRFMGFLQFNTEHVPFQGELEYRSLRAYIDKWLFYKTCNVYTHEYSIVLNNAHACNLVCILRTILFKNVWKYLHQCSFNQAVRCFLGYKSCRNSRCNDQNR